MYVCLLLSAGPGQPLHTPAEVTREIALQRRVLEEDVRSQAALSLTGLPLDLRDEVHVPADQRGIALRRALCDLVVAGRDRSQAQTAA